MVAKKWIVGLVLAASALSSFAKDPLPEETATLQFYRWYMKELVARREPLDEGRKAIDQFIGKDLHRKLDAWAKAQSLDSDYFIKAQDFSDTWADNISVRATERIGNEATVVASLQDRDLSTKVAVQLKKVNGHWKIVGVFDIN
jgi:hypothetical protein